MVTLSELASSAPASSSKAGGYQVLSHHDFGSVQGRSFESQEEALRHWKGLSLFAAHMLLGPEGQELRYYGRRGGRDSEMRRFAGR